MSAKVNYLVIGSGAAGSVLVDFLTRSKKVGQIVCVSKDGFFDKKAGKRIRFVNANIKAWKKIPASFLKSDIVINAASPYLNEDVLKLALRLKLDYMDLSAYLGEDNTKVNSSSYKVEHLKYHDALKNRGLKALFDAGAAPGLTNLLVTRAYRLLGGLEKVIVAMVEESYGKTQFSTWSPEAMVDEIESRPVIFANHKFKLVEPFSENKPYIFPQPFGKVNTYPLMNNEAFTIPKYLKLRHIEVRSGGSDMEKTKILYDFGLFSKKKINMNGQKVASRDFLLNLLPVPPTSEQLKKISYDKTVEGFFVISVAATNKKKKIKLSVIFPSQSQLFKKKIFTTYVGYAAGVCAAAFALEMPFINKLGAFPPEALETVNQVSIMKRLKKFGLEIKKTSPRSSAIGL